MSIASTTWLFDINLPVRSSPDTIVDMRVVFSKAFFGRSREQLRQQVSELELAVRDMGRVSAGEAEKAAAAQGELLVTRAELLAARREALRAAVASVTVVGVPVETAAGNTTAG